MYETCEETLARVDRDFPELLDLSLSDLPRVANRDLAQWIRKYKLRTIRDLLTSGVSVRLTEPAVKLVDEEMAMASIRREAGIIHLRAAQPIPPPDVDTTILSLANFDAWTRNNGVEDMLATPVGKLLGKGEATATRKAFGFIPIFRQVLQQARGGFAPAMDLAPLVIDVLEQEADERRPALEAEAARELAWATAPTDPTLATWWKILHKERKARRERAPVPTFGLDFTWTLNVYKDRMRVSGGGLTHPFEAAVGPWTNAADLASVVPHNPATVLTVVDALLDMVTGVAYPEARASLLAILNRPPWERQLTTLDRLLQKAPGQRADQEQLGWRVRGSDDEGWTVYAVWVKRTKTGSFTHRTANDVAEAEQYAEEPTDLQLLAATSRFGSRITDDQTVLNLLVGHPRVFSTQKGTGPVEVVRGEITLRFEHSPTGELRVVPRLLGASVTDRLSTRAAHLGAIAMWQTENRLVLARLPLRLAKLSSALTRQTFPAAAAEGLLQRIHGFEDVAPVELAPALRGAALTPDLRPLLRLNGEPCALRVALRLRPLPEHAPLVPGEGPAELYAVRDGMREFIARDFDAEARIAAHTAAALGLPEPNERWLWSLEGVGRALRLLRALRDEPDLVQVEWAGPPIRVGRRLSAQDVRLSLGSGRDWFGLQGTAEVDGHRVDLAALLEAAREGQGWVRIKDGAWVDLQDTLHELLGAAAGLRQGAKGEVKLAPTHAPLIQALADAGAAVDAPAGWWSITERIEAARTLDTPVPADLNATLRSYQAVGFQWLAALASWAPGAVLADDMGLGKTLQSIALLLHRREGLAVVVAPTSVVDNWASELAKFAPALRAHVHRGAGRIERLRDARPGDVVLASYDTLARDQAAFAELTIHTLVIDEAHHIKNPATQRAKTLHAVRAGFVLALSGTPVENHLLDLWSLIRAASPGLLGGLEAFRTGLAADIQERHDPTARAALARLVRPFILRRTKREVETELPARTEIVLPIDLSAEERALYERERLAAVMAMAEPNEGRQFQIFAALTRLRQLACHPRLVDPTSPIASSKLARAVELLLALREDGHKTLVFSQFTQHLKLLREALVGEGVRLRYLDGSTPAEQRGREVAAFQAGDGDAFLISLKAGGTGLNLTAATYVLHLDPWWNPAAEDQATDRAHRIGQVRPVTVYRLVTRGTIEEQVVKLHSEKRELAAAVLEGTDSAHRASAEELLALIATGVGVEEE